MNYRVEFGTSHEKCRAIGEADTIKDCRQIIMNFLDEHSYKSHYQRMWFEHGKIIIDFGSWSEFFWISYSDGSKIESIGDQI